MVAWALFSQVMFCAVLSSLCIYVGFMGFPFSKHASNWIGYAKLRLSVNMSVFCTLWWTGIQSRVYSCLSPSVPGTDSRSTMTLISIKLLVKINE